MSDKSTPAFRAAVLDILKSREMKARDLRAEVEKRGVLGGWWGFTRAARFYAQMAAMEDEGSVAFRDITEGIDGHEFTCRWYRLAAMEDQL